MAKKPDNIVFDEQKGIYDAYNKPYATNFSSPVITTDDVVNWKNVNVKQANNQFKSVFNEIKSEYDSLIEEYSYNEIIYNSKFNFEPIVGQVYHLYKKEKSVFFLSILSPTECTFDYVDSFRLNSDKIWKKERYND